MNAVDLCRSLDGPWLAIDPVVVGHTPTGRTTADWFALVWADGQPFLRIDLYRYPHEAHSFQAAMLWANTVVIGWGERVHLVNPATRQTRDLQIGSYFAAMHPAGSELLITSAERVFCLAPDGTVRWISSELGIDGVVLHTVTAHTICGSGEWDPPGGWKDFRLSAKTGALL